MRLNAFLARAGVASRRSADEIIKSAQVLVNGNPAKLNDEVGDNDVVTVGGKQVLGQSLRYILLNKPTSMLTTLDDPHGRPKVTDLVKIEERVVPVGRLDYDTTGALLLTNDGELAHRLMHPSFEIDKIYVAKVKGSINNEILNKLSNGLMLEDGMTAPANARKTSEDEIEITIHEGKNRQVKRMIAAVGLKFVSLKRINYGALGLDNLEPGQWRDLTPQELKSLMSSSEMVQ